MCLPDEPILEGERRGGREGKGEREGERRREKEIGREGDRERGGGRKREIYDNVHVQCIYIHVHI